MKHSKLLFVGVISFLFSFIAQSQSPYQFTSEIDLEASPVISQGRTGTCWSFSSTSFLESEIKRLSGKDIDLSEMYTVRNTYPKKAENYIMRQGKAQFSEGGLAHDVINVVATYGLVPQQAYSGLASNNDSHNHAELIAILTNMVETYVKNPGRKLSSQWRTAIDGVLDVYLGEQPESFKYEGKVYTPQSFLEMTQINPEEYVTITSFSHVPYHDEFILNIPDNWSYGSMHNVTLNEFMSTIDYALNNGFTVELDCDVSERSFSSKDGVAVIPKDAKNIKKALQGIYPERNISQEYRQQEFENYNTTDDHLMHITGILKDQNGTTYYKVKNSWGKDPNRNANGGYVYFSESYMRLKAISIMIHKDAVPESISKKLKL